MSKILTVLFLLFLPLAVCAAPEEVSFVYNDHGKRDPLWRLVSPAGSIINYDEDLAISDVILDGIIYDPSGASLAIINGVVVKVNDKVGFFIVRKIEEKKVTLFKNQEKYILELKKEE